MCEIYFFKRVNWYRMFNLHLVYINNFFVEFKKIHCEKDILAKRSRNSGLAFRLVLFYIDRINFIWYEFDKWIIIFELNSVRITTCIKIYTFKKYIFCLYSAFGSWESTFLISLISNTFFNTLDKLLCVQKIETNVCVFFLTHVHTIKQIFLMFLPRSDLPRFYREKQGFARIVRN